MGCLPILLQHCPANIRADRGVVLAAVKVNGWNLKYASDNLRADPEVVLEAFLGPKTFQNEVKIDSKSIKNQATIDLTTNINQAEIKE